MIYIKKNIDIYIDQSKENSRCKKINVLKKKSMLFAYPYFLPTPEEYGI